MDPIQDILSNDLSTRARAANELLAQRVAVIEQLIEIIELENATRFSFEGRGVAAYVLGEMRAIEAVPALARDINSATGWSADSQNTLRDRRSPYDDAFCNALVKIGRPAVPEMIKILESTDERFATSQAIGVLIHVLGGQTRLNQLLTKTIAAAGDAERRERLQRAAAWVGEHFTSTGDEPLY